MQDEPDPSEKISPYFGLGGTHIQAALKPRRLWWLAAPLVFAGLALGVGVWFWLAGASASTAQTASNADDPAPAAMARPDPGPTAFHDDRAGPEPVKDAAPSLETQRAAAELMLRDRLADTHGLVVRDVRTVSSVADGQPVTNFCGQVNVRNPAGVYTGFQRFVSSPASAVVEQDAAPGDFQDTWRRSCGGAQGPAIWR